MWGAASLRCGGFRGRVGRLSLELELEPWKYFWLGKGSRETNGGRGPWMRRGDGG